MSIQIATFINETDLPIQVDGLIQVMVGLNKLDSVLVLPNETCKIRSITGEWFLNTYFNEKNHKNMWIAKKMHQIYEIGKFHNSPCIMGNYSWLETDIFEVTYVDGIFKFSYSVK
jgi:hypothetical protein